MPATNSTSGGLFRFTIAVLLVGVLQQPTACAAAVIGAAGTLRGVSKWQQVEAAETQAQRQNRELETYGALDYEDAAYKSHGHWRQRLNIQPTDMGEEEQKEEQRDRQIKKALIEMMSNNWKIKKEGKHHLQHMQYASDSDYRREFATDEANPYIDNSGNCFELP